MGRELLAQMRIDPSAWSHVSYRPRGKVGHDRSDLNASSRMQLAWALQRDFLSSDGSLLRFALEEEVKWREEDPWQGVGETLEILGALTAQERDVRDVWLLVRAKRANFDTGCGFDVRHAFAAGVEKTILHIQTSDRSERQTLLDVLLDKQGAPRCSDEEVREWLDSRPDQLPPQQNRRARVFFERALSLGRRDMANFLLDEEIRQSDRDADSLRAFAYDLESLERWSEASALRKERLASIDDDFEEAGEACAIARLERLAKNPEEGERFLLIAGVLHGENDSWRELGLRRMFVEECFRTARVLDPERGAELFTYADSLARNTPRLPLVALEAAVEAAEVLKSPLVSYYRRQRRQERKRNEK